MTIPPLPRRLLALVLAVLALAGAGCAAEPSPAETGREREEGFTLIELLLVIIGILAAIAIPSFLNQREKG